MQFRHHPLASTVFGNTEFLSVFVGKFRIQIAQYCLVGVDDFAPSFPSLSYNSLSLSPL